MSPFELVSSICLVRLEINPIYDPSNLVGRIRTYHRAYKLAFEWGVRGGEPYREEERYNRKEWLHVHEENHCFSEEE
jgi:hypothetical protein